MVMVKAKFPRLLNGDINIHYWLENHFSQYTDDALTIIRHTIELVNFSCTDNATFYGQPCVEQGLECAEILSKLNADAVTIAAAIVYCSAQGADIELNDLTEHITQTNIITLAHKIEQTRPINTLHAKTNRSSSTQIDNLRKMLLAMVQDVRTVLVTLARQLCIMRGIQILGHDERRQYAEETMDVYAPLANRLGLNSVKWELEDLAFHDLNPSTYKLLGAALNEKRSDRELRVANTVKLLNSELASLGIDANISGRAKHLYSIYKKMQRKSVPFEAVYDTHAVRIIVPTIDDCYKALGWVHDHWAPITEEFDDYIATPKPNGYQSIHTAVTDQDGKYLEIQIRTQQMHQENELGVAAHWIYKENSSNSNNKSTQSKTASHEAKVVWLRELLAWHKSIGHHDADEDRFHDQVFEERIYVFTPNGDIIDLAHGSTALDFAYHIHSDIGHRCRGAKINGKLETLTHRLSTGDNVEIITSKTAHPSRDWLNPELGYLATAKARAKVHQWFRRQDIDKNIADGKQLVERELQKLGNPEISMEKIAHHLGAKTTDICYAGIACGNIKPTQLLHSIKHLYPQIKFLEKTGDNKPIYKATADINTHLKNNTISIDGINNLLTHIARCCNPLPGEAILGYVTQGKGVSIHRENCKNIVKLLKTAPARILEAHWETISEQQHAVTLVLETENAASSSQHLTSLLTQQKVHIIQMVNQENNKKNIDAISCTIKIPHIENLTKLISKIQQLPGINAVTRT